MNVVGSINSSASGPNRRCQIKSPPDIGLVDLTPSIRASVDVARSLKNSSAWSVDSRQRCEAGIGRHFDKADIGRRLKMMADTRATPSKQQDFNA